MIEFRVAITGTAPILMHNARLADPLDPVAKALKKFTAKRTKTDDDHEAVARVEHAGSLYMDSDVGPYIPGQNITKSLIEGARTSKQGVKVTRGVFIATDINPLAYNGPRTTDALWNDVNFRYVTSVPVGRGRVMRCRPIFREWATEADGVLDPNIIDLDDLAAIATTAGQIIGLGDWRPRFGRFTATVTKL